VLWHALVLVRALALFPPSREIMTDCLETGRTAGLERQARRGSRPPVCHGHGPGLRKAAVPANSAVIPLTGELRRDRIGA
jgi:hypothetical protein